VPVVADSAVPERLRRFVLADWVDGVPPEPGSWAEVGTGWPWVEFKAKRLWQEARREWCRERGVGVLETFSLPAVDP